MKCGFIKLYDEWEDYTYYIEYSTYEKNRNIIDNRQFIHIIGITIYDNITFSLFPIIIESNYIEELNHKSFISNYIPFDHIIFKNGDILSILNMFNCENVKEV